MEHGLRRLPALAAALLTILAVTRPIQAQVAQKMPTDKVQTREELRACMQLKDAIAVSTADWQKRRDAHEATRGDIRGLTATVKAGKGDVDAAMAAFKEADAALAAHRKLIDRWNEEVKEVDASTMRSAERRKAALQKERVGLETRYTELQAAREEKVKAYEASVARYNANVNDSQAKVRAWNLVTEALEKEGDKLTEMRRDYGDNCANRRFREEDEEAIRTGR